MLPQNVVEGSDWRSSSNGHRNTYADERQGTSGGGRPPVAIEVCDRFMVTECVVGPPLSEPLIGQIVLEGLDLIADCAHRTLTPRTPDYPTLKLK